MPELWQLTSATCSDGSPVSEIDLGVGETVTCTFQNTKFGEITIELDAVPDSPQDFFFTTVGSGLSNFRLDDDGAPSNPLSSEQTFSPLGDGARRVREVVPDGWVITEHRVLGRKFDPHRRRRGLRSR